MHHHHHHQHHPQCRQQPAPDNGCPCTSKHLSFKAQLEAKYNRRRKAPQLNREMPVPSS